MCDAVISSRFRCLILFLMSMVLVGCGGPYYTIDGSLGAKQLVVHDGKNEIKIDIGTSSGGNLSGDNAPVDMQGKFTIESPDGVTIVGTVEGAGRVAVSSVEYKGKKLGLGSMTDL